MVFIGDYKMALATIGKPDTLHSISVYVPNTDNSFVNGEKIVSIASPEKRKKALDKIVYEFAQLFGGATLTNHNGAWIDSDTGKIVYEDIIEVQSLASELTETNVSIVLRIAASLKAFFNQDSVLIVVNGQGYFI